MRVRIAVAAIAALTFSTGAQSPAYKREVPAKLVKDAKIAEDSAVKLAMKRVPAGAVKVVELEKEKGKLIWSIELASPGKSGIDEVNVDAVTGAIVGVEHEK